MKTGIEIIAAERERQINEEGWTQEHDAQYVCDELADAAVCYAMRGYWQSRFPIQLIWPFAERWWKPSPDNRVRELAKAGALIAAEIDRLNAIKSGNI